MTLYHPRPRFVTLDPILVVDYFCHTRITMDFKTNLFKYMAFNAIENGGDLTGNLVVCVVMS